MKVFVILSCLLAVTLAGYYPQRSGYGWNYGSAPLDHTGRVVDTTEVAARKAEHAQAYARALARNAAGGYGQGWSGYDGGYGSGAGWYGYGGYGAYGDGAQHGRWHGPIHIPRIKLDGNLVNTPEVQIKRNRHALSKAIVAARAYGHGYESERDNEQGAYLPLGYEGYAHQG